MTAEKKRVTRNFSLEKLGVFSTTSVQVTAFNGRQKLSHNEELRVGDGVRTGDSSDDVDDEETKENFDETFSIDIPIPQSGWG